MVIFHQSQTGNGPSLPKPRPRRHHPRRPLSAHNGQPHPMGPPTPCTLKTTPLQPSGKSASRTLAGKTQESAPVSNTARTEKERLLAESRTRSFLSDPSNTHRAFSKNIVDTFLKRVVAIGIVVQQEPHTLGLVWIPGNNLVRLLFDQPIFAVFKFQSYILHFTTPLRFGGSSTAKWLQTQANALHHFLPPRIKFHQYH